MFSWARGKMLAVGPALLLLALMPSLSYTGHWGELFGGAAEPENSVEHEAHEGHCHYGPSSCADQPVPPNFRSFADLIELPRPSLTAFPIEDAAVLPIEFLSPPPVEPPRV